MELDAGLKRKLMSLGCPSNGSIGRRQASARIVVDPPSPEPLARGVVVLQYRADNIRIVPVFRAAALAVSPRVGHLHVTPSSRTCLPVRIGSWSSSPTPITTSSTTVSWNSPFQISVSDRRCMRVPTDDHDQMEWMLVIHFSSVPRVLWLSLLEPTQRSGTLITQR
jgi:Family of unknown function (DUF6130)